MNNIIEEATPIILLQDSLNPYRTHFEVDDYDEDGHVIEVNDLVDTSYPKITPLGIDKFEPPPSPPIAPLLKSPIALKLKPLPDASIDILPVIPIRKSNL